MKLSPLNSGGGGGEDIANTQTKCAQCGLAGRRCERHPQTWVQWQGHFVRTVNSHSSRDRDTYHQPNLSSWILLNTSTLFRIFCTCEPFLPLWKPMTHCKVYVDDKHCERSLHEAEAWVGNPSVGHPDMTLWIFKILKSSTVKGKSWFQRLISNNLRLRIINL